MNGMTGKWQGSLGKSAFRCEDFTAGRRILSDGFIAALVDVTRRAAGAGYRKADTADRTGGDV